MADDGSSTPSLPRLVTTSLNSLSFLLFCSSALISLLAFVFYQLYLHPLAKYPGPLLGKITTLYAAYHAWKGDIHLDIWRCHERYGIYLLSCNETSRGINFAYYLPR